MSEIAVQIVPDAATWQQRAACNDRPEPFYYSDNERREAREEKDRVAQKICELCPVKRECLVDSVVRREPYGTWGGVTQGERAAVLARLPHPKEASPQVIASLVAFVRANIV